MNKLKYIIPALLVIFIFAACSGGDKTNSTNDSNKSTGTNDTTNTNEVLNVVTSFTLLEDIVKEIGGEKVKIHNLVPTGTDPHEYEPLPEDNIAATDADILFYNGLHLEGDDDSGWFSKLMDSANQDWDRAFELSKGVEPMYFNSDDGEYDEVNPHAFLDPVVGVIMAENARDALMEIDPDNASFYEENSEDYINALKEMDEQYAKKINDIPEENRIFITSERAYQYMADRYGLKEGFIWAIDTEENGSPDQITSLIKFIEENNPPVLFVETNVDKRPMETVSNETGIEIFGEVFSDEIGNPGEEGDTYVKFLQHNIDVIYEGLK